MSGREIVVADSENARQHASQVIAAGGLIAYRTDTLYGLGADPFNPLALNLLKALKGRDDGKPILVIISESREADRFLAMKSKLFEAVTARHWPGALTIVSRAREEVPDELTAGTKTIGVRLPDDSQVRELVRACGGSLTATSANPSGFAPAQTAQQVASYFSNGLDLIIDGGQSLSDKPSTVLDVSADVPRLIREGVITREQLLEISDLRFEI
ncbi:MAG: threonylcarbamoyl-AMP synthase [Acidobacteria bacterium]|nr:threonylcarbamoyl-AMP synthase [Acidobacteriota bacterium]